MRSNPGSISLALPRLRTKSPAPISRTSDIAICATTSTARGDQRDIVRPAGVGPSLRAASTSAREDWAAGTRPKRRPVRMESSREKPRTRQSRLRFSSTGTGRGGRRAIARSVAQAARTTPPRPATSESRTLSVRSWRRSRPRLAPRASRTAVSRRRAVARASRRPATLVQAMSRTSPTTARSRPRKVTTAPRAPGKTRAPLSGTTVTLRC